MVRPGTKRPCLLALALTWAGCGLTVTNERPTYEELEPVEKSAVDIIVQELARFNAQVKARTKYKLDGSIEKEHVDVSFEGLIFAANLGDDTIHVSVWENVGKTQQQLVATWFASPSAAQAQATYSKFFYRFLAVAQGVKQFMFVVLTPTWLYSNRTLWSMERDAIRTTLAHYEAEGRRAEMWPWLMQTCQPVLKQYAPKFSSKFTKSYLQEHLTEIFNPEDPSGYMYFICRWIEMGEAEAEGLDAELKWIIDLPLP